MKRVSIVFLAAMAIATMASAQATRTWVSGVGDDANPCSRTAPCKTFAGAISKTASPGIINCLDPGGYGAVTITKSITIDCTGTYGSVLASGTQGVVVNALTTDKIVLRAIDINGAGTTLGTNGVNVIQAGSVRLETVNVASFSGSGLQATNTSNFIELFVTASHIINNGGNGILINPSAPGTAKLIVNDSDISNNVNGIDIGGASNAGFVFNSSLSGNSAAGFQVEQSTSGGFLEGDAIFENATGVFAGIGANTPTIRLSRCAVYGNTSNGIGGGGSGVTACFSNNTIAGNAGSNACSAPNQGQQ